MLEHEPLTRGLVRPVIIRRIVQQERPRTGRSPEKYVSVENSRLSTMNCKLPIA